MKRFAQIVIIFIIFFMTMMVMNKVKYHYTWEDTFWRTLLAPITKAVWAKNFSETNFIKIKIGMTHAEIFGLLGEPLDKNCNKDRCIWYYSEWHKDAIEFDRRWVAFDVKGRVNYIWRDYYID